MARTGILDDFAPKPTVFTGGMARMIRLWECCRDANAGGYGSGVLQSIRGWGKMSSRQVTSCSPRIAAVCRSSPQIVTSSPAAGTPLAKN